MNLIYFVKLHNNSWRQCCRTVICNALDGILLLHGMRDDKMCVHNDRNDSNSLVLVYTEKSKNKHGDDIYEEPGLHV
jgi:hypothetical protein